MEIIRTLRLKVYLESKGFKCLGTMPNKYIEGFLVFIFEKSDELNEEIKYYLDNKLYINKF